MEKIISRVLILVVMEDGLVQVLRQVNQMTSKCLNPCCNGRWSRTIKKISDRKEQKSLNPCCNGRWSRTQASGTEYQLSDGS